MTKKPLRCGIVGTGAFAKLHAQAIANVSGVDLVAAYDTDRARCEDFTSRFGGTLQKTLQDLLKNALDIVVVATSNAAHADVICAVLKDVRVPRLLIVEKPLCVDRKDLNIIGDLIREKKIPLIVDHTRRFNAGFQQLQGLIVSGEMGTLRSMRWRYYAGWFHIGAHVVDTVRMLIGECACTGATMAQVDRFNDDPLLDVTLQSKQFPHASIVLTGVLEHPYKVFEGELEFSQGRIRIEWNEVFIDRVRDTAFGTSQLVFKEHFTVESTEKSLECLYEMCVNFLSGKDKKILDVAGFDQARRTMEVLFDAKGCAKNSPLLA